MEGKWKIFKDFIQQGNSHGTKAKINIWEKRIRRLYQWQAFLNPISISRIHKLSETWDGLGSCHQKLSFIITSSNLYSSDVVHSCKCFQLKNISFKILMVSAGELTECPVTLLSL